MFGYFLASDCCRFVHFLPRAVRDCRRCVRFLTVDHEVQLLYRVLFASGYPREPPIGSASAENRTEEEGTLGLARSHQRGRVLALSTTRRFCFRKEEPSAKNGIFGLLLLFVPDGTVGDIGADVSVRMESSS